MLTLADHVRINAARHADHCAVVDDHRRVTHAELSSRAIRLAASLAARGVGPGERIGVLAGNSVFAVETFLACAVAGAVYVPFNWRWTHQELGAGIELARPSLILAEIRYAKQLHEALAVCRRTSETSVVTEGAEYEELQEPSAAHSFSVMLDDPLCILFTGGTTGRSKGVVLSHRSSIANAMNELVDCGFGRPPFNTALSITPMFHAASLITTFIPHYITGGTNVLRHQFQAQDFSEIVSHERVHSTFLVPNMIRRLLAAGVLDEPGVRRNLRQLHTGAGLFRMPDKRAVIESLPDVQLFYRYGLTEAGPMVTRLLPTDICRPELDGSIGQPYSFTEVEIQGADGNPVPAGTVGEICVRGPNLMTEYFEQPGETTTTLRGGWLHTGDLAVQNDAGYVFFRDRAKDMIKSGGENVYASEVEQVLYSHPAVMECGVLGVPSEEWDEEVRAVLAIRPGFQVEDSELRHFLRGRLAGYKVPKRFLRIDPESFPVSPSGKVLKSRLRQIAEW